MPIVIDATSSVAWNFESTGLTLSHTTAGSNRLLAVATHIDRSSATLKDLQYGGIRLSPVATQTVPNFGTVYLHTLVGPASGANNIVADFSNGNARGTLSGTSYTGVDQTTPLGTAAQASGVTATPTVNVTSATGELVIDAVGNTNIADPGAGQTERVKTNNAGVQTTQTDEAGAGTVTMSRTIGASAEWAIIAVPVKADAGAVGAGFPVGQRMRNIKVPNIGA